MEKLTSQQTRYALRISTIEGNFAGIHGALTGGMFLIGYVTALGGGYIHFGLIAAIPTICTLVQLPAAYWLQIEPSRRGPTMASSFLGRFCWIVAPFLPFFFSPFVALWIFFGIFALSCGLLNIAGNGWMSWMEDLVPRRLRGRYFSRRNMIISAVSMIVGTLAAYFIDYLKAGRPLGRWFAGLLAPIMGFMKDWADGATNAALKAKVELGGIGLLFFLGALCAAAARAQERLQHILQAPAALALDPRGPRQQDILLVPRVHDGVELPRVVRLAAVDAVHA
jgi:MFS family permease